MLFAKDFFKSWPVLTVESVTKYVSNTPHASAGRIDHVRKIIRSTKLKQVMSNIIQDLRTVSTSQGMHLNSGIVNETQDYYANIEDLQKIYTDQTGRFPTTSSQGSKYCFMVYSFDANAVLVEPIKNRTANELLGAHAKLVQHLIAKGYKPNMHYLDNKAPDIIKVYYQ